VGSLLAIITAFTLAHSITLALSVLAIVTLPSRFVEPVIALSIAYVAAENILKKGAVSRRWAVSFLFGLVHGFGFAGALREVGLPADGLAAALIGFNLGVEIGQAAIIAAVMPAVLWARRFPWQPRVATTISAVILVAGLVLLIERAFLDDTQGQTFWPTGSSVPGRHRPRMVRGTEHRDTPPFVRRPEGTHSEHGTRPHPQNRPEKL
jgi:hypothetical protein